MKKMSIKKEIVAYCLAIIGLSMWGCGETVPKEEQYSKMLPKTEEYFEDCEVLVTDPDGGQYYSFQIEEGWSNEQSKGYIEAVIDCGFDDIIYYSDEFTFGAYTQDGKYWCQIGTDNSGSLYVNCNRSNHNPRDKE